MNFVDSVMSTLSPKPKLPEFKAGDSMAVHVKVKEGEKERIQVFSGTVIKVQGSGQGRSFTVRKVSEGIGVERTWPLTSPAIAKIELKSIGKVRRSRLFYLRQLKGRAARLESEYVGGNTSTGKGKKAKKKAEAAAVKAETAAPTPDKEVSKTETKEAAPKQDS